MTNATATPETKSEPAAPVQKDITGLIGDLMVEVRSARDELKPIVQRVADNETLAKETKATLDAFAKSLQRGYGVEHRGNKSDDPMQRFSLMRAIQGHCSRWGACRWTGVDTKKFPEYQTVHDYAEAVKAQSGDVASAGGFLVGVTLMPDVIEFLRPESVAQAAGVRMLTGLVGNDIVWPKELSAITVTRDGEAADASAGESSETFGDFTLRRKRASAYTKISLSLLRQTNGSIQRIVEASIAKSLALRFDLDFFKGAGAGNVPLGLVNTLGIGTVSFSGLTGGASQTTTNLLDQMIYSLRVNNAYRGRPVFVAAPGGVMALRKLLDSTGKPILFFPVDLAGRDVSQGGAASGLGVAAGAQAGVLYGHPIFETTQLNGTGANSDLIFFNPDDGLMALWDNIEIVASEHAEFKTAQIGVRAIAFEDSGLLRGVSACIATSFTGS